MRPLAAFVSLALAGTLALTLVRSGDARGDATAALPAAPAASSSSGSSAASLACPPTMVLVQGGSATLGAAGDADALAPVTRSMAPFCIDRTEVTVAQYQACAASGSCARPETTISFPGYGPPEPMRTQLSHFCNAPRADHVQHPMNCVDESTAARYCAWEGGRLPDEEEWEYAARGPAAQHFPWGSTSPNASGGDLCWDRRVTAQGTCAVGQFPGGASPAGALDMAGNVWEWTTSHLTEGNVVRGGGWTNFLPRLVSSTYRWPLPPTTRLNCLGFRCVRPVGAAP